LFAEIDIGIALDVVRVWVGVLDEVVLIVLEAVLEASTDPFGVARFVDCNAESTERKVKKAESNQFCRTC
jgi:hypothetical protein